MPGGRRAFLDTEWKACEALYTNVSRVSGLRLRLCIPDMGCATAQQPSVQHRGDFQRHSNQRQRVYDRSRSYAMESLDEKFEQAEAKREELEQEAVAERWLADAPFRGAARASPSPSKHIMRPCNTLSIACPAPCAPRASRAAFFARATACGHSRMS